MCAFERVSRTWFVFAAAMLACATANAQSAKTVAGKYTMEADPTSLMELRADGTAEMSGEETRWSVKGNVLTIGTDAVPFQLKGDRLVMTVGPGVALTWIRSGAAGKGPSPLQKAVSRARQPGASQPPVAEAGQYAPQAAPGQYAPQAAPGQYAPQAAPGQYAPQTAPAAASVQDQQAIQLLTSTAWCSFTYNQYSGTSSTSRVVFRPDGVMVMGSGAETYNSGSAGTVAGQSSNSSVWRWRVENLRLLVDTGQGLGFQDVNLQAYKNSSGYPILKAQGKEYSMCK